MASFAYPLESLHASWIRQDPPSKSPQAHLLYLGEPPETPPEQILCRSHIVTCSGAIEHEGNCYILTIHPKSRLTACNCGVEDSGEHVGCRSFKHQVPPPRPPAKRTLVSLGNARFRAGHNTSPEYLGLIPVQEDMCQRMGLKILQYPECISRKEIFGIDSDNKKALRKSFRIQVKSWESVDREMLYDKTYPPKFEFCHDINQSNATRSELQPFGFGRGVRGTERKVERHGGTKLTETMPRERRMEHGQENACGSWVMVNDPNGGEKLLGIVFTDSIGYDVTRNPPIHEKIKPSNARKNLDQFTFITLLADDGFDDQSAACSTINTIIGALAGDTASSQHQSSSNPPAPEPKTVLPTAPASLALRQKK